MRKCPACNKWTLDFDDYFGRFRCFNAGCGWMPPSSVEREIQLLQNHRRPTQIAVARIEELGLQITFLYDDQNDALLLDFGLDEPTFDLPEGDGRMIWRIGRRTNSVVGFTIVGAKQFGVSQIRVNFSARKEGVEEGLRRVPGAVASGRATKLLVDNVEVTADSDRLANRTPNVQMTDAFNQVISDFGKSELFGRDAPYGQSIEFGPQVQRT